MTTLDDLELELRKLPGVRATGFTERDDVLLVQIHVGEEETEPGLPLQATRIAYRHSDRPVAVELVRWRTRRAAPPGVGTGQREQTQAPPPAPSPTPTAAGAATAGATTGSPTSGSVGEPAPPAPQVTSPPPPAATPEAPPAPPEAARPQPEARTAAPGPPTGEPIPSEPTPPAPPSAPPEPVTELGPERVMPLPSAPDQAGPQPPPPPHSPPPQAEMLGAPHEGEERRSDAGDEDRVRLLAVLTFPDTDELEVHLTLSARRTIGRAAASRGLLAAVEATLDALRGFVPALAYEPAWARTLETSSGEGFLVAAGLIGTQTQTPRHGLASGASAIEAAARATLQALNRSIVFELATMRNEGGG